MISPRASTLTDSLRTYLVCKICSRYKIPEWIDAEENFQKFKFNTTGSSSIVRMPNPPWKLMEVKNNWA